jgi:hypothetical protein
MECNRATVVQWLHEFSGVRVESVDAVFVLALLDEQAAVPDQG